MNTPDWLLWAREMLAIARTGLTYTKDRYDIARYQALRELAARMLAARTEAAWRAFREGMERQ